MLLKRNVVLVGNGSNKYFKTENKSLVTSRKNTEETRKLYQAHELSGWLNKGKTKPMLDLVTKQTEKRPVKYQATHSRISWKTQNTLPWCCCSFSCTFGSGPDAAREKQHGWSWEEGKDLPGLPLDVTPPANSYLPDTFILQWKDISYFCCVSLWNFCFGHLG